MREKIQKELTRMVTICPSRKRALKGTPILLLDNARVPFDSAADASCAGVYQSQAAENTIRRPIRTVDVASLSCNSPSDHMMYPQSSMRCTPSC